MVSSLEEACHDRTAVTYNLSAPTSFGVIAGNFVFGIFNGVGQNMLSDFDLGSSPQGIKGYDQLSIKFTSNLIEWTE